ncbi:MAG TPA: VIT family protein [Gemmatimonadaceae bacterium]|jgi:VIT1/CCC1 family predicted Fe2+/Mn2+ transporter|nr:VIT family protein [Gemmatimonadaceae bacterium]
MRTAIPLAERHKSHRIGWLRAAVLGANDGIVSTSSLIVGVAAANSGRTNVLIAGIAGLVSGAISMAAGEYVSVSSQSDTEKADLEREKQELESAPDVELRELRDIYVTRGLDPVLAMEVAQQRTARGALSAHMRDELGISEMTTARPIQAALASAATFSVGAALPLITVALVPIASAISLVSILSLFFLAGLGMIAAKAGGSNILRGAVRVTFWGALAMGLTAVVGKLFGAVV